MELQEITEFIPQRHAKNENKSRIFMNIHEFYNQSDFLVNKSNKKSTNTTSFYWLKNS